MKGSSLHSKAILALALSAAALFTLAGCTTGVTSTGDTGGLTGAAFVVGTDAPMASVVSFSVPVVSVIATDAGGNTVSLVSGSPTVDFARYNGLQTLLDMNDVPEGTYTSIAITLGEANLGYLQTGAGAPTIATEMATYPGNATTYTYTKTLTNPLVIAHGAAPVGLRIDLNLAKSIGVDGSGNITGAVTPTFNIATVKNSDGGGHIDTLYAGVLSVDAAAQSFAIQGPHGRTFTVDVNGQTSWENGDQLSSLTTSSIVEISGTLDNADSTIDADDIAIVSQSNFYAAGQITYVTPAAGNASSFDLYTRAVLPASTGLQLGQIAQVNLTGSEKYFIYKWHSPLTGFFFNQAELLPGQHVSIGGPASGATNSNAVTTNRVVLHFWGFNTNVVAGSVNTATGTFQVTINGFAGQLVPQTVTVVTDSNTTYRDGLTGLSAITNGENIRVVGLLMRDPISGNTFLAARYVDQLQ